MKTNTMLVVAGVVILLFAAALMVVFKPFEPRVYRETHAPALVEQSEADLVRRFHYLEDSRTLVVYFEAASRMDFKDVPAELGQQAMDTEDATGFYLEHIKGMYSL